MATNVFRVGADVGDPRIWRAGRQRLDRSFAEFPLGRSQRSKISEKLSHRLPRVAVIDGPYDVVALAGVLTREPIRLGTSHCTTVPGKACAHGTFIMGMLGAGKEALIPGICPNCELLHVPLFVDGAYPQASIAELAAAIEVAVSSGAQVINLSLAILGEQNQNYRELAEALDHAEASGAVVVAAAGNQGRLVTGQILAHPVTIPVLAVDETGRLLPECNFGPQILLRGVSALGRAVRGYGAHGGVTVMSGTSVATAIATGIVAEAWAERPDADGAAIRAAVMRLGPRCAAMPPLLTKSALSAAFEPTNALPPTPVSCADVRDRASYVRLQGRTAMSENYDRSRNSIQNITPADSPALAATPAQILSGCSCGGTPGSCTCGHGTPADFVYVLGTVDVRIPDQSISDELERIAETKGLLRQTHEDLRTWCYRILTDQQASAAGISRSDTRYIARQLIWILTIEGLPAYYLTLRDPNDLDDLIACLGEPKHRGPTHSSNGATEDPTLTAPGPRASPGKDRAKRRTARQISDESKSGNVDQPPTNSYGHRKRGEAYDLCLFVGLSSLVPIENYPGIEVPTLAVDYLCSFELATLLSWIKTSSDTVPAPPSAKVRSFSSDGRLEPTDFFHRIIQSTDNFGHTNEWRALNYLAVQYPRLYRCYADMLQDDYSLDSIKVVKSRLWGAKNIVDPVFTFRNESGHLERYFVRVDVSHLFPTIVNHLAGYFER